MINIKDLFKSVAKKTANTTQAGVKTAIKLEQGAVKAAKNVIVGAEHAVGLKGGKKAPSKKPSKKKTSKK